MAEDQLLWLAELAGEHGGGGGGGGGGGSGGAAGGRLDSYLRGVVDPRARTALRAHGYARADAAAQAVSLLVHQVSSAGRGAGGGGGLRWQRPAAVPAEAADAAGQGARALAARAGGKGRGRGQMELAEPLVLIHSDGQAARHWEARASARLGPGGCGAAQQFVTEALAWKVGGSATALQATVDRLADTLIAAVHERADWAPAAAAGGAGSAGTQRLQWTVGQAVPTVAGGAAAGGAAAPRKRLRRKVDRQGGDAAGGGGKWEQYSKLAELLGTSAKASLEQPPKRARSR